MLFLLNDAISSFSFRHRLHMSDELLKREHFVRILHVILGAKFLRFFFRKLKDALWLLYLFLNMVSTIPIQMSSS